MLVLGANLSEFNPDFVQLAYTTQGTSLMLSLPYTRLLTAGSRSATGYSCPPLHCGPATKNFLSSISVEPLLQGGIWMGRASFTSSSCPLPSTTFQHLLLVDGVKIHPCMTAVFLLQLSSMLH